MERYVIFSMVPPDSAIRIRQVTSEEEVVAAFQFAQSHLSIAGDYPRSALFYREKFSANPELILILEQTLEQPQIIGCVLGSINERNEALVGELVIAEEHRGNGWGKQLMAAFEANAKKSEPPTMILGAQPGVEGFYAKCGFTPDLFIQVPKLNCLPRLEILNPGFAVAQEEEQEGWTRFMLKTGRMVPSLEQTYKAIFPEASIIYVFSKSLSYL